MCTCVFYNLDKGEQTPAEKRKLGTHFPPLLLFTFLLLRQKKSNKRKGIFCQNAPHGKR